MITELNKITFIEAIRKIHEQYGIYSQFIVDGDTVDNFQLVPRTDKGYDAVDMQNLSADIDFLTEAIQAECEV